MVKVDSVFVIFKGMRFCQLDLYQSAEKDEVTRVDKRIIVYVLNRIDI